MKAYDDDLKWRVVNLWMSGMSTKSIVTYLAPIGRTTVQTIKRNYRRYGMGERPFQGYTW